MAIFLNPVSLLELPAAWISLSIGMEIGISLYPDFVFSHAVDLFWKGLPVYIFVVIPLLVISGIIEVTMIKVILKKTQSEIMDSTQNSGDSGKIPPS